MVSKTHGSFIAGRNPFEFNINYPLILLLVQLVIIIAFGRVVKFFLKPLKQPSIIADVLVGIILGPTCFGRIPKYTDSLFPKQSLPFLQLLSNIGLVLFLFLVGLELGIKGFKRDFKKSLAISLAGIIVPFSSGAAVSYGMYNLIDSSSTVSYPVYLVFIGAAMSTTAGPVLTRILAELKLLNTRVANTVLSASAIDDCVTFGLIAVIVSLVNADDKLESFYIFLIALVHILFVIFFFKPMFVLFLRRSDSINGEPSALVMCVIFTFIFINAFIADAIGIDAMFGGFLAGLIIPHDNGFSFKITEKIEDVVVVLLLPIFFTVSGMKTQLGVLNDGNTWAMLVAIITVACVGKFVGCAIAAKLFKFDWRDSLAIGVFMNCKGIVEHIVLNIGLDAGVISKTTYSLLVVMELATTFITCPLASIIYPKNKTALAKLSSSGSIKTFGNLFSNEHLNITLYIIHINSLPSMMNISNLLKLSDQQNQRNNILSRKTFAKILNKDIKLNILRLIEITERFSSVVEGSEIQRQHLLDPVSSVFSTYATIAKITSETTIKVSPISEYIQNICQVIESTESQFLFVPWDGSKSMSQTSNTEDAKDHSFFEYTSKNYSDLISNLYLNTKVPIGIFVDRGFRIELKLEPKNDIENTVTFSASANYTKRIYLPLFGNDDPTSFFLALRFALQKDVEVTVCSYMAKDNILESKKITDLECSLVSLIEKIKSFQKLNIELNASKENHRSSKSYRNTFNLDSSSTDQILIEYVTKNPNLQFIEKETLSPFDMFLEDIKHLSKNSLIISGRNKQKNLKQKKIFGNNMKRIDGNRRRVLGDLAEMVLLGCSEASLLIVSTKENRS